MKITLENEKIFDPIEYEKEHLIRLYKSAIKALDTINPIFRNNLKRTINRYIDNHKNTIHKSELKLLIDLHETISKMQEE